MKHALVPEVGSFRPPSPPAPRDVVTSRPIVGGLPADLPAHGREAARLLRAAAADVRSGDAVHGAISPSLLSELVEVSCRAARGQRLTWLAAAGAEGSRRAIDALRSAVLDRADGCDPGDVLAALRALDAVQTHEARDCAQHFQRRLSAADAMSALTEVAHDMRSPLTSILLLVDTLRRGQSGAPNATQEHQLGIVYEAAFGLSAVVSDLIEMARGSRLANGDRIAFSVAEILHAVRDIVQPIAEEKGLTIEIAPPSRDSRLGHPTALHRVLLNLATNALKYTDEGGISISATECSRSGVEFVVSDSGRGMCDRGSDAFFAPFPAAGVSSAPRFSSSGLGLSICRRLVDAMGGALTIQTTSGAGTRVSFALDLPSTSRLSGSSLPSP